MKAKARSMVLGCAVLSIMSLRCAPADDPNPQSATVQAAAVAFTSTAVVEHDSRCMDVTGAQTGDNVNLIQWNCHGANNQSFTFTPVSGVANTYTINTFAGKCVTVSGASTADNAAIVQLTCDGSASQQFRLVSATTSGLDRTFNLQAAVSSKCIATTGASTTNGAQLVQIGCSAAPERVWQVSNFTPDGTAGFQTLPNLPTNVCNNTSLPKDFGTNFPTPRDPFAFGFFNQSAIGWQGNFYPVFSYLSGSYFARGVPNTFTQGSTNFCGAMYSFSAFTFGLAAGAAPPAQSIQWTMDSGFLPALTTSFTRNNVAIAITNFADRVVIGGNPLVLAYTRVAVTNNGTAAVTVPPGGSGPNLVRLTAANDTVQPGQTVNNDFVAAVDRFGGTQAFPSTTTLAASAPSFDTARAQMAAFWTMRINATAQPSLPNLTLPNTGLTNPGTALLNAYRAGTAYHLMMQVGKSPFSAANNYAWLLNHDIPGELASRFSIGDYSDARNLLLVGRTSERRCRGSIPTGPTGTSTACGRRHGSGRSTSRRPTTPASSASSSTTPRPSSARACAR
jgi:hypothetical protein